LAEHESVTGIVVLKALRRVLNQTIDLPTEQIQEILAFLETQPVQPKPKSVLSVPVRDEDDQWALASALAAKADVLVTGDHDLLDVAGHLSDLIITDPRGFWNLVKKSPKK
jgi:putative PIN family toxin of toxin-antitoxin system